MNIIASDKDQDSIKTDSEKKKIRSTSYNINSMQKIKQWISYW